MSFTGLNERVIPIKLATHHEDEVNSNKNHSSKEKDSSTSKKGTEDTDNKPKAGWWVLLIHQMRTFIVLFWLAQYYMACEWFLDKNKPAAT